LDIEEQILEKREYLQYLRTLISSAAMGGRTDLVLAKEEELESVKTSLDELEFELSKLKIS
jgi:hypothetical protein